MVIIETLCKRLRVLCRKKEKKIIKVYKKMLNIITITIIITAHYYTYYLRPKFWRVIFRFKIVSFSALQVSLM